MIYLTDDEICILSRVWHASTKGGTDNWQEQHISDWLKEQIVSIRVAANSLADTASKTG